MVSFFRRLVRLGRSGVGVVGEYCVRIWDSSLNFMGRFCGGGRIFVNKDFWLRCGGWFVGVGVEVVVRVF